MNSNRSSRSGRSAALAGSAHSSGTEDYEIPEVILNNRRSQRNRGSVIEINETQEQPGLDDEAEEEEDDDVILIPEHIETIDLCTQVPVAGPVPRRLRNQVIDITGSPAPPLDITMPIADLPQSFHRIERIARRVSTRRSISAGRDVAGPSRGRRNNNRAAPYVSPVTPATAKTSTPKPPAARALSLDDSFNASQLSAIKINCPICLESVKEREPISTMCGHVFCKACIQAAMVTVKKCPMCKKNLPAKNPFIHLFI